MGKESVKQMGQGLTDQGLMVFRWSASAETALKLFYSVDTLKELN